ncbi:MAG: heavy metal translocating P-type ATPase, partial [Phycisphaerales bacterium]|nr:heavy metal translocating P-type ATPase [Phycisphaerales bacterium]
MPSLAGGRRVVPAMPETEQTRTKTACAHCGLDVPQGLIEAGAEHQFCCNGCKTVYSVLQGAGLGGYYSVKEAVDSGPIPATTTGGAYEELDDPVFQKAITRPAPGGEVEAELLLEGMHCAACVWLIERLPRVAEGVVESRAHIRRRTVCVRYKPERIKLSQVAQSLDRLGYAVHPARGRDAREARLKEDRRFLIRVAVAGALAGNIMLLAVALYQGSYSGMSPFWQTTLRWYSMGLGLVALLWPGRLFFRGAIAALRTRTAHLDLPIALALLAGGVWGVVNTVRGTGEIYFDSLGVLVFLLLVGRWIQHRQQRSASDSVELMLTLTPTSATVVDGEGNERRVPIETVEPGMVIAVGAGESIAADGEVVDGQTDLDLALLTGESRPVEVCVGDEVPAGATNLRTPIRVRVSAVGESTRVGKLMSLIARASSERSPIVQFADRVAGRFVVVVISLAIATFAFWAVRSGIGTGIEHATALLIVTCPCALGLATPMAMSVAMGRAARSGMLVKSASAIEQISKPGTMILDKTGTITEGSMRVVRVVGDERAAQLAGVIERSSNHPIARAICDAYPSDLQGESIDQTIGRGIEGIVDGVQVRVGSPAFAGVEESFEKDIAEMTDTGHTPIGVHAAGVGSCVLAIGDRVRAGVADSVLELKDLGWDLRVCSGDDERIVAKVASEVGIETAEGGVSPEGKTRMVRMLKTEDPGRTVVMVGDGVND